VELRKAALVYGIDLLAQVKRSLHLCAQQLGIAKFRCIQVQRVRHLHVLVGLMMTVLHVRDYLHLILGYQP
jgi:hypothetical protein